MLRHHLESIPYHRQTSPEVKEEWEKIEKAPPPHERDEAITETLGIADLAADLISFPMVELRNVKIHYFDPELKLLHVSIVLEDYRTTAQLVWRDCWISLDKLIVTASEIVPSLREEHTVTEETPWEPCKGMLWFCPSQPGLLQSHLQHPDTWANASFILTYLFKMLIIAQLGIVTMRHKLSFIEEGDMVFLRISTKKYWAWRRERRWMFKSVGLDPLPPLAIDDDPKEEDTAADKLRRMMASKLKNL